MKNNYATLRKLDLPERCEGTRVLDVGAMDGYFSFECEKRGASVLAIDSLYRMQRPDEKAYSGQTNKGFVVAKEILNSNVEYRDMDVCDVSPDKIGMFDVVLFLGVIYHLKYPMLALEKLRQVTSKTLYMESAWVKTASSSPLFYYAQGDSINRDPTNWFIPNTAGITGMLKDCGFKTVSVLYTTPFPRMTSMIIFLLQKRFHEPVGLGRIILKAEI